MPTDMHVETNQSNQAPSGSAPGSV